MECCVGVSTETLVLQIVKFYTVRRRTTVRNVSFFKILFHYGVNLTTCKTVFVETPT